MTMPGDHIAADAADHCRLRASRAEREHVIEVLKTAFVQDRLTKDEFDTRVGRALTSQICAELTEVTADLPAGPMGARPPRQVVRTRQRINRYSRRTLTLSEWSDALDTYYAGTPQSFSLTEGPVMPWLAATRVWPSSATRTVAAMGCP
jgi:hypothetical protein